MAMSLPARFDVAATGRRRIVTVCTMVATLMQALDGTIANVALPHMQGSLSASTDQITWVLTSYIIAAAILTAPVGWLAQRFGRKTFFMATLIGFTVTSMLCGLAQTLPQMVLFRFMQGMFGAALTPLSQSTMLDMYPPEQRGPAMAVWGMGVMVGPIIGPTLGGYLTETFDWRWVFYVNLPFGILAVAGLWFFMDHDKEQPRIRFDWLGFLLLSTALASLQLILDRGGRLDWFESTEICIEALLAGLGAWMFVVHTLTAKEPFIKPTMFRDRNFLAGLIVMLTVGLVLMSSAALLPSYLQRLGGYSVTEAGLLMAPRGIGTMVAMMIAGRLTNYVDARILIAFGVTLMATTLGLMSHWTPDIDRMTLVTVTSLQGFGMGFVFIPLQVVAFATLPPLFRTDAAALFSLMRNVGSAVGISAATLLLAKSTYILHLEIAESVTALNPLLHSGPSGMMFNPNFPTGLSALNQMALFKAEIAAYRNDFTLMFWASFPAGLAVLLMRNGRVPPSAQKEEPHYELMEG